MAADESVVGEVVGPISRTIAGSGGNRYTPGDLEYDIALGGMPFVLAPSKDRPYARETADFKKDQVDQSSTVGDQSLVGYWTRGQLSFHRGAGLRFYDVTDGDAVPNRYNDSLNVDTWTAGAVTLRPDHVQINATALKDVIGHNSALLGLSNAGTASTITLAGTATAKPSTTGGAFSSITSDGVNAYGTNGNKIEVLVPAGSFALLWTHHIGGRTWSYVWWAKDRLWAVDNAGDLFTLSAVGGVTAGSDILWSSRKTGRWSLAEAAQGVLLSNGNTVFLSSIDTSTATPTLTVPSSVAIVGPQETISCIGATLGYLAVFSDVGSRIGLIGSSGVSMGPLINTANYSTLTRVGYRKDFVLAVGGTTLFEFDVLEQVADLQAAYTPVRELGVNTSVGSTVLADGRTVTFSDVLRLDSTGIGTTGFLQTAYHRLGTLELKDFRTVVVRAEGLHGSIAVELVKRDGSFKSLVTLTPADFAQNEISLNVGATTEYIALRFTLSGDGVGSPTLLGYQLRALPAPVRQRLIQLPLMCFDDEVVGSVKAGHDGWAWERLQALEDLEAQSTVLVYQDFTTGEQATVSIERLQFQRFEPTKGRGSFGGFIVVTLRKVT